MLKVSQLLKFIASLNPQTSPAKLSFANFLQGFVKLDEGLSPELIDLYFEYSLDYPHWIENKEQFGKEIQQVLVNFNSLYPQKLDLSQIRFPQDYQVIEIENAQDWLDTLTAYLKAQLGETAKFRLLNDQNKRALAIVLGEDRSVTVRTFDRKFTLRKGQLEPLRRDLTLHYTPQLELDSEKRQKLVVAPYVIADFVVQKGRVQGALLRGYVFQKLLEFRGDVLEEQERLYIPLKRIEQFFVDRDSDSYYQDLVHQLERTLALIQQGDHGAARWSPRVLTQAENALDQVYSGDRLLSLLVRDLRHSSGLSNKSSMNAVTNKADEEWQIRTPTNESDLIS